jgi:hypothetical protein
MLLSVLPFGGELGQKPYGKIHTWGLYSSWVFTKLSDLSQGLKGILFSFKIFSLFEDFFK